MPVVVQESCDEPDNVTRGSLKKIQQGQGQPSRVFSYKIGLHETKWGSSSGEVRLTVAQRYAWL